MKRYAAEFAGTFILVYLAVGSAVFGIDKIGAVGVALAFGLVLLALAAGIGPVSGCHVNPGVTLGMLVAGRMSAGEAGGYVLSQLLGGVAGASVLKLTLSLGEITDQTKALGSNGFGMTVNSTGAFLVEALLTMTLVLTYLLVTERVALGLAAAPAVGLALAAVHLVGIPLTGTSVNPARSLGPALLAGGERLEQLWLFLSAPLVGGAAAALLAAALHHLHGPGENAP
ncbi:aquaporin [Planomonospora venezuelensis]|uniref:Aquaporin Z n=1 Tax=Planomonospora venezuelensis TaxID=1999 RepID=A0A841D1F7_PLAVE|nr:aquaporin [Planomonospora venezuelensis]MBB5962035.1 aquaporin Z [Planomonospora venezuelensis]GIN00135.1 aquaporin Z [Planomonospora venezuelensis]